MVGAPSARTTSGELAEVAIEGPTGDGGGDDFGDFKSAAKPAAPGRRPSIQLTVDSRAAGAGPHMGALSVAAPAGALAGRVRTDSGGLDYAPDSKAVMARINRWWKKLDEGVMQPRFGGPASSRNNSSANLALLTGGSGGGGQHAGAVQGSGKSFTVPVSRPGG